MVHGLAMSSLDLWATGLRNAYIQIALMGTNFCTSAKKAFFLILRNAFRFGTVAILGVTRLKHAAFLPLLVF